MMSGYRAKDYEIPRTGVTFRTGDVALQKLYDKCEALCRENLAKYNDQVVLREGAVYDGVWLETQPMGGEMYAKRDVTAALDNVLIFLRYQRRDGRLPGCIMYRPLDGVRAYYDWFQGDYLSMAALKLSYYLKANSDYLRLCRDGLAAFDEYLWRHRDSDGDGCLESWCIWDTGEDNCTRYTRNGAKEGGWGGEDAPYGQGRLPYESAMMMAYSCQAREVLGRICDLLGEKGGEYWHRKAQEIRDKIRDYLWDDGRKACFDRDCDNVVMPILTQSNLCCMYFNAFSQEMADDFVRLHLMSSEEFFTPVPLASIAANDPYFEPSAHNNWSGSPQGLTYQRAIDALMNYGHHAEVGIFGEALLRVMMQNEMYVQQYDPFTGKSGDGPDGYGPTMLAALEYIALTSGVRINCEWLEWSCAENSEDFSYEQRVGEHRYCLSKEQNQCIARIDGTICFRASSGLRVRTDRSGNICEVIQIARQTCVIQVETDEWQYRAELAPNEVHLLSNGALVGKRSVPFYDKPVSAANSAETGKR